MKPSSSFQSISCVEVHSWAVSFTYGCAKVTKSGDKFIADASGLQNGGPPWVDVSVLSGDVTLRT